MEEWKKQKLRRLLTIVLMCLTLGLAPFSPEPHIWMDIKWVWNGAVGMTLTNWFDLLLHGAPWVWLLIYLTAWYFKSKRLKNRTL